MYKMLARCTLAIEEAVLCEGHNIKKSSPVHFLCIHEEGAEQTRRRIHLGLPFRFIDYVYQRIRQTATCGGGKKSILLLFTRAAMESVSHYGMTALCANLSV